MRRPDLAALARSAHVDDRLVGLRDLTVWQTRGGRALVRCATWLAGRLGPHLAVLALLVLAGGFVAALTGASGELYEQVAAEEGVAAFDRPVLEVMLQLRSDTASTAVTAYTDLGGPVGMPVLTGLVVLAMTVAWRQWTPVVLVVLAAAGSLLITVVGKALVGRIRPPRVDAVPPYEESAAFPSGHALNAVVLAGVLAYLLVRRQHRAWVRATTLAVAAAFAVTMGLSRVYLGHHWLTDVLVAWTLGLAWLTVVVVAHRLWLTVRRHRQASAPP